MKSTRSRGASELENEHETGSEIEMKTEDESAQRTRTGRRSEGLSAGPSWKKGARRVA